MYHEKGLVSPAALAWCFQAGEKEDRSSLLAKSFDELETKKRLMRLPGKGVNQEN